MEHIHFYHVERHIMTQEYQLETVLHTRRNQFG